MCEASPPALFFYSKGSPLQPPTRNKFYTHSYYTPMDMESNKFFEYPYSNKIKDVLMTIIYDSNKLLLNKFNHNIFTILMYKNAYLKDLKI